MLGVRVPYEVFSAYHDSVTVDPFENESAVDNELLLAPPETVVPPLAVMVPECPSPLYVTTYVASIPPLELFSVMSITLSVPLQELLCAALKLTSQSIVGLPS